MGTMISCATLSRKLMDRVHWRTDGLVLSETFFETFARVAALETDAETERTSEIANTGAIHARGSMCFYFTANKAIYAVDNRNLISAKLPWKPEPLWAEYRR